MDNTSIRNLHTIMVQIDESDPIDISMPDISDFEDKFGINPEDYGQEPDYDEEENHSLDGEDDWIANKNTGSIFDPYDDDDDLGEDPWGIGEGEAGHPLPSPNDGWEEGDDDTDWADNPPKASEIGLSRDFDKFNPYTDHENISPYDDDDLGDDPWGIGEGGDEDAGVPDDIQISQDGEDDFVPDDIQLNERDVREYTNKIHQAIDDGIMDARDVADAALKYMSEDDVADMVRANDWTFLFPDEYDDEENDLTDAPYNDSDADYEETL